MKLRLISLLLALVFLTSCAKSQPDTTENTPPVSTEVTEPVENREEPAQPLPPAPEEPEVLPQPDPRQETIEAILSAMTLEEKVGQMFFVRCPAADQTELIGTYHLGGYLLFGRDFKDSADNWLTAEQFADKIASYQSGVNIPLLIGVDEEGGTVARATATPTSSPPSGNPPSLSSVTAAWRPSSGTPLM